LSLPASTAAAEHPSTTARVRWFVLTENWQPPAAFAERLAIGADQPVARATPPA
jgi:hypothetical protein